MFKIYARVHVITTPNVSGRSPAYSVIVDFFLSTRCRIWK